MTLSFSQKFPNGRPTYFIEKIYSGFERLYNPCQEYHDYYQMYVQKFGKEWSQIDALDFPAYNHKVHTIRRDSKNRWKVGNDIHFVINNRTKDRFQFAPILKVTKIQTIEIDYCIKDEPHPIVIIDGSHFYNPKLGIDKGINLLAMADGFDSIEKLFGWFSEDFTGKIIHWTDLYY